MANRKRKEDNSENDKRKKSYKNKTGKNPITGKDNKHTRIKVKWTTKRLTG